MTDLYLLATVRMKELQQQAERARRGRGPAPWESEPVVGRGRIVVARWLMAAAGRLWPEAGREVLGGAR
jgi:hypothetical protein